MFQNLINSPVNRQDILDNPYAVAEIQKAAHLALIQFEGAERLTKEQIGVFLPAQGLDCPAGVCGGIRAIELP